MSAEIVLVLGILGVALVLFITERVRMDVVSLMVLSALALTGLVTPEQAISGFSNAAVVTVWAMFILSEGLSRAGVANLIGAQVMHLAGRSEVRMIVVIMLTAGVLSGFMNNIGVAALMLPVIVDVAQRSGLPASRLLMPLAYGTLLGGLTTLVGTPPNLLISGALADAGLKPFGLFEFTPLGAVVLVVGTLFVATVGRHLLPATTGRSSESARTEALRDQYLLKERMFLVRIPSEMVKDGKTLADLGLASSAGLVILALLRSGSTRMLPGPDLAVRADDTLLVQGRLDRFEALRKWRDLEIERESPVLKTLLAERLEVRELMVAEGSRLAGEPVRHAEFRARFGANILAVRRGGDVRRRRLSEMRLKAGDHLLVQCNPKNIEGLEEAVNEFAAVARVSTEDLDSIYALKERVFVIHVPRESEIDGLTVSETRLGDAFDFRLLAIFRDSELRTMPLGDDVVRGGDLLIAQGRREDVDVLRGLQHLEVLYDQAPNAGLFDSEELQMVEAILDPHSNLAGTLVSELNLRERYQLELAAIWRNGRPYRSELTDMRLSLGDVLLLIGPRERLAALKEDKDFIVLTPISFEKIDTRKAPLAGGLMMAVVASVLTGWLPISIAAVIGATLMVLTRCLSMENAYRAIDWRSIFLIAGMLPLGIAMEQTGAAQFIANSIMAALGDFGPWPVIAGLYALTAIATMIIPTAALVVLVAPIVLSASADMGVSPHTAMMAVAVAASASFTSPISHPANVLVMGPGGYRFVDYLKLGVPLTLVVFAVVALLLPILWPLRP